MRTQQNATAAQHLQIQNKLLQMEHDYEKSEFEQLSAERGIESRAARGLCWFPVRLGRSYYNSLNRFVVEVTRVQPTDVESGFEYGKKVRFFYQTLNGDIRYLNFPVTVSFADETHMALILPSSSAYKEIDSVAQLGVDTAFDETTFAAMRAAITDVINATDNRLAHLRDVLIGNVQPSFRQLPEIRFPWLNASQQTAVNRALCSRDVMVVHGPPGTGKTTTLVEVIVETLKREPQVMVCAQSNAAVDWICEKLIDRGVSLLRIGNPARVNDKVLSATYEHRFADHSDYPELWSVRKAIRDISVGRRKIGILQLTKKNKILKFVENYP